MVQKVHEQIKTLPKKVFSLDLLREEIRQWSATSFSIRSIAEVRQHLLWKLQALLYRHNIVTNTPTQKELHKCFSSIGLKIHQHSLLYIAQQLELAVPSYDCMYLAVGAMIEEFDRNKANDPLQSKQAIEKLSNLRRQMHNRQDFYLVLFDRFFTKHYNLRKKIQKIHFTHGLKEFPDLSGLPIKEIVIRFDELSCMTNFGRLLRMQGLRSIALLNCSNITNLYRLPQNLQNINLRGCTNFNDLCEIKKRHPNLRRLDLSSTGVINLNPLRGHKHLESVTVGDNNINTLDGLENLPMLTRVTVKMAPNITEIIRLSLNPKLRQLSLQTTNANIKTLVHFTLQELTLIDIEELPEINYNLRLQKLTIQSIFTKAHCTFLCAQESLKELALNITLSKGASMQPVIVLTELTKITAKITFPDRTSLDFDGKGKDIVKSFLQKLQQKKETQ